MEGRLAAFVTSCIDHVRFFTVIWWTVRWATIESENDVDDNDSLVGSAPAVLHPWRAGFMVVAIITSHTIMEIIYGLYLLGPQTLASVKKIQLLKEIQDGKKWQYLFFMASQMFVMTALASYFGIFTSTKVVLSSSTTTESLFPFLDCWKDWLRAISIPYFEFLMIAVIKDATSMSIIHPMMHNSSSRQHKWLHDTHQAHHKHRANLNNINGAEIDGLDLFLENGIGPFLLVLVKICIWGPSCANVSLISFLLLVSSEGSAHSLNPYSICYYFPPLDAVLKANIAHHLHHVKPNMNYTSHPWHHLWQGYQHDLSMYNTIMKTNVQ